MTETAISPLRQRMIDDMTVRHFVEKTRTDYIRQVRRFAAFLGRSPETASPEEVRQFQLHLTESGVTPPSRNAAVAALRFFFTVTLDRADLAQRLTLVHEPRKVPLILSPVEVAQLLEAAPGPKYKAALSAAYGAGLRVSEVVALKVCDIDSQRMLIRIEQGKGRKDRYAMLSPQLLALLRDWWRIARRELTTGVILGLFLGLLGATRILLWHRFGWHDYGGHPYRMAATIWISLAGVVAFGSVVGSMLPLIMHRIGVDPASASAPFVATLVDVTGLVIYFLIAIAILSGTVL